MEYFENRTPNTQYIELVRRVVDNGERKHTKNRNRPDNFALSGQTLAFDLRNGFPIIMEKQLRPGSQKAIIVELLWLLSGRTDLGFVHEHDVHIWDKWADDSELAKLGLPPGNLGPIYPHQWRNFGATRLPDGSYAKDGVDQIARLIRQVIDDPDSKAHKIVAWNPKDFFDDDGHHLVTIVTCHGDFQIFHADGYLDLCMNQRSADILIGLPFNIASYAWLLMMIAQLTNFRPRKLTMFLGDAHIYEDQLKAADDGGRLIDQLLGREPRIYPTASLRQGIKDIFGFELSDFHIEGYDPHPPLDFPVTR